MHLRVTTEYPRTVVPGEAMWELWELVRDVGGTNGTVDLLFEANQDAVLRVARQDGGVDGGAVFGASLASRAREFELAAVPRGRAEQGAPEDDFKRFNRIFEDALFREGFRLIATVPMPSTGLWSRHEIDSVAKLGAMRVRTYDPVSREVFESLGCRAVVTPFARLGDALEAGELDAVLASGDGVAGERLSRHFSHYLPVAYSIPLCFLVLRDSSYRKLHRCWQRALKWAGPEVQFQYWSCHSTREEMNLKAIQRRGVRVSENRPRELMEDLERKGDVVRRRVIAEHGWKDVLVPFI
jgi:TRAP-type C4-dicarboxylate transport system substrate-binding protein